MKSPFESAYDSISEIKCPFGQFFDCWEWMDREQLKDHLKMHPEENQDPEHYWMQEAERRFELGPLQFSYYGQTKKYAA